MIEIREDNHKDTKRRGVHNETYGTKNRTLGNTTQTGIGGREAFITFNTE